MSTFQNLVFSRFVEIFKRIKAVSMQDFRNGSVVYPGVVFAGETKIDPYVLIGYSSSHGSRIVTKIGADAHIRSHTTIYAGNIIGSGFRTGHGVLVRENNSIGNNVSIGSGSIIEHDIVIGDQVRLHSNVFVPEFSVLKDGCWIGPGSTLTNAKYPASPETKDNLKGPSVGTNSIICANVTILPGVIIGDNALIGAGSVVTHDIAQDAVAIGNPAKEVGTIYQYSCYKNRIPDGFR